jgi:pyruvate dehydrogenase E2 component (dihydrolipoamide acetyltransferase)
MLRVPKWGLSMEEGTVALWLIEEGEEFSQGQDICEIETSKIANVMEAPFAGRLHRIIAHVGDTLPVQGVIAVAAPADVDEADVDAALAAASVGGSVAGGEPALPKEAPKQHSAVAEPSQGPAPEASASQETASPRPGAPRSQSAVMIPDALRGDAGSHVFASPRALRFAASEGLDLSKVTGTGRAGRVGMRDVRSAVQGAGGTMPPLSTVPVASALPPSGLSDAEVDATPVARRLAKLWEIPLAACRPTGRNGRVCKADVEAARARSGASGNNVTRAVAPGPAAELPQDENPSESIAMTGMRRTIASRLSKSKLESPHFRVAVDVEVDALNALRKQINAEHPGVKVSVNDFVIKAVAMALVKHPQCNIQFDGDVISQFRHADVSVAVAMDAGLITPIVRTADTKSLVAISSEMRQLATKAKASTLRPEEFQGGTFTVSNLGMFGVSQFDAIINPPQAAILAVGGAREEVRFRNGQPAPYP